MVCCVSAGASSAATLLAFSVCSSLSSAEGSSAAELLSSAVTATPSAAGTKAAGVTGMSGKEKTVAVGLLELLENEKTGWQEVGGITAAAGAGENENEGVAAFGKAGGTTGLATTMGCDGRASVGLADAVATPAFERRRRRGATDLRRVDTRDHSSPSLHTKVTPLSVISAEN